MAAREAGLWPQSELSLVLCHCVEGGHGGAGLEAGRPVRDYYWVRDEMKFSCNIIYLLINL